MIVIQAEMNHIPESCTDCELSGASLKFGPVTCSLCIGRDKMTLAPWAGRRRAKGCPLVENPKSVSREQELADENMELKKRIVNWRKYMAVTQEQVGNSWKGEWIRDYTSPTKPYKTTNHCSRCNHQVCWPDSITRFCPSCGAPMTEAAVLMVMDRLEDMSIIREGAER